MNAHVHQISHFEQRNRLVSLDIPILDSELSANDSHESLIQMLFDLKCYHRIRNFSHQEKFGEVHPQSEEMVLRLGETIDQIKESIDIARQSGKQAKITSTITVEIHQ